MLCLPRDAKVGKTGLASLGKVLPQSSLTLDDDGDWIKRERVFITPGGIRSVPFNAIPDLTDPVTLERILDVVCDAHLEPFMETRSAGDVWVVTDDARRELSRASSERLALVQALEAAG